MNKLFLLILSFIILSFTHSFAQGNLQFNQVLLLTSTAASNLTLGTVPANKVWKVESLGGSTGNTVVGQINGSGAGALGGSPATSGNGLYYCSFKLPTWLPAGTQFGFSNNGSGSQVWFSIIEFNIVP